MVSGIRNMLRAVKRPLHAAATFSDIAPLDHKSTTQHFKYTSRVKLLYAQPQSTYYAMMVAAFVTAKVLFSFAPLAQVTTWFVAMALVCLARARLTSQFAIRKPDDSTLTSWNHLFCSGALMTALLWGVIPPIFLNSITSESLLVICVVLCGICTGALAVLSVMRGVAIAYTTIILAPLTLCLVLRGGQFSWLGIISSLFLIVLIQAIIKSNDAICTSIDLQFQNQELARYYKTERNRAEKLNEDLKIALKGAQAAVEARAQFLANMSHEIRTPMNGIVGLTDIVLETALDDEQRENLEMARECATHLCSVINDILDFSTMECSELALEARTLELQSLIHTSMEICRPAALKKEVELVVSLPSTLPNTITIDPGRLRQVFINLLANAIKFTPPNGTVTFSADAVRLEDRNTIFSFAIRDTGIGISKEAQKTIFQAFAQADSSIQRHYGGTGLGLAISSNIVQRMGGTITLQSEVGTGSTFVITLPVQSEDNEDIEKDFDTDWPDARHEALASQRN